jgi:nitrite reductase/ring-hydroxylating ferredoxin subunit
LVRWVKIFPNVDEAQQRIALNSPQLVVIDGIRVCVVQHGGKFFAVQDSCTHNGESLSKGKINHLGEVICPWHNYCFDLQTGRELSSRSADLKTFPIKIDETGFFIGV